MEFTQKELLKLLDVSQVALTKAFKNTPFILKKVEGSIKAVKHYKLEDLPERYKVKIEAREEFKSSITNLSLAKEEKIPKAFTTTYLTATPLQQEKALLKVKIVEYYLQRDEDVSQHRFLEKMQEDIEFDTLGNISLKQLNDWLKKYNISKAKGLNVIEAFIDTRGKARKNLTSLTKEMQEMAERYFLKKSHITISNIYLYMCHAFGDLMPSYDTLNKFYKRWKKLNPQLCSFAKSPDEWKNNYQVAIGDESEKAYSRNIYWEFDATPADIICNDGKRYTILGLIDIATRRCVFTVEDSNSSYAVSRLLRKGILKFGIPENVVLDNGKEFVSRHFESICYNLEIVPHIMPPFSGEKKPFIERMFGTMARQLFAEMKGFIGHNVAMKTQIQAKKGFAHKIEAQRKHNAEYKKLDEEQKKAFANLFLKKKENIGIEINCSVSKEALQKTINDWVTKIYEQKVHRGLGKKPIQAWNSYTTPVQSIADKNMLDLLLGQSFERVVRKKGIGIDGSHYWEDELISYMGKTVKVMTSDDMGEVMVYDPVDMRLICRAFNYELSGRSREIAMRAKKQQIKARNLMQKAVEEAEKANDPTIFDVIDGATGEIKAQTYATTKKTATTQMLLSESSKIEEQDKKVLEQSRKYDFKGDEPKKVHENNRREFKSFEEKILFILRDKEDPSRDEKLNKFKRLKPDSYKRAKEKYEKEKTA